MRNAVESYLVGTMMPCHVASDKSSVHALIVAHLAHVAGCIEHAVVVRWLDMMLSSLHIIDFIARLARHVADAIGLHTAHTVSCEAA